MRRLAALLALVVTLGIAVPLIAQEDDQAQKSGFIRFVEDRLSTPERRISLNGLEGALSSDVAIAEITFADDEGVWLRIQNAKLNWNQTALITGRLQINSLTADSIDYIRPSIPPEGVTPPAPEAGGFEVPELPVAVTLEQLSVPSVTFGEEVFGLGSEVAIEGRLVLEGGSLDTNLDITRKDGPGGRLVAAVKYQNSDRNIDLDIALTENRDGVVANLLNITGRPAIVLNIKGSGPVDSLAASLTLDADGTRALTGRTQLSRVGDGLAINADMRGPIANLIPPVYRAFFGEETQLTANALLRDSGGLALNDLQLAGGQLSLSASADTASDGFLTRLDLDARIADSAGAPVLLPVSGQTTNIDSARLTIDYGKSDAWVGALTIDGLDNGSLGAEDIRLDLQGAAVNLNDPATRRVTFNADGAATGITARDPQIADALGTEIGLGLAGLWSANAPLQIAEARVAGKALDVSLDGNIADFIFNGAVSVETPSLAPFSGLAGRQLSGAANLVIDGTLELLTGAFDLGLSGTANSLGFGIAAADNILAGETRLSGRIGRSENGLSARAFQIVNERARITANGTYASTAADFAFTLDLDDLARLSDNASGPLSVIGTAKGADGPIALKLTANVPNGKLAGRTLTEARLGFDGSAGDAGLKGQLTGNAFLDGYRASLQSAIAVADGVNRLTGLNFDIVGTNLTGDLVQSADGLLTGQLDLASTDLSMAAALLLTEATGAANASIALSPDTGQQQARVTANLSAVKAAGTAIGTANVNAVIADLFGVPAVNGTLNGADISAGGIDIKTLAAEAAHAANTTGFSVDAALENGTDASLSGSLTPVGEGYRIALDKITLDQGSLSARLIAPTALTIINETVTLDDVQLDVGGGRVTASGTAGTRLDLGVAITALPLSIANTIRADLGLGGTLDGTVRVSGTSDDPQITFDIDAKNIVAQMIAPYGITPLTASASGSFAEQTLTLAALQVNSPSGLAASANGTMPLIGSSGNLAVTGTVPLTLANRIVGERGTQISGTANINARVTGSLAKPLFNGAVTTANSEIIDPQANLRLQSITTSLSLNGDRLVIDQFTGNLATGGSVSASGTVGLDAAANFPADIRVRLNAARYADGNMFVATASGDLAVTGALLRDPLLSGDINLERAEISIPDFSPANSPLIAVDHVNAPIPVTRTLARTRGNEASSTSNQRPSVLQFDINVTAPGRIFVRGRGVDAELGGALRLTGSATNIQPVGGFELIRGRLTILGQRITFTSGSVTLVGDLNPYIDLTASSAADDTTVFVTVTGPVSDLDIEFSSDPELPQDEVLSLLIFKRALGDLSPLQLAKLAAAAAELAGGGNNSLTDDLREATGLDDLDIVTDSEGNAAVKAGRYLQDNIYVSVQAGAEGKSKVSLDLDLTDTLKARGSATSDGETSVGIFYEQDY